MTLERKVYATRAFVDHRRENYVEGDEVTGWSDEMIAHYKDRTGPGHIIRVEYVEVDEAGDATDGTLPDDLPGRDALLDYGIDTMEKLRSALRGVLVDDIKDVPGIGPATETKLREAAGVENG